jgi:hypothetical protein
LYAGKGANLLQSVDGSAGRDYEGRGMSVSEGMGTAEMIREMRKELREMKVGVVGERGGERGAF